jgi:hypothetical protein
MRDASFIRRLETALPEWAKSGFLSAEAAKDILAFEKERAGGGIPYLTVALSILGVLLLGSGIISFFAANWQWLPKIAKLAVLFGGMWAAYAIAGYMLGRGAHPLVGQAVLLLGVLLFGANIWLVAQIYHISSHYPNGVLIWAIGALFAGYLLRSHPVDWHGRFRLRSSGALALSVVLAGLPAARGSAPLAFGRPCCRGRHTVLELVDRISHRMGDARGNALPSPVVFPGLSCRLHCGHADGTRRERNRTGRIGQALCRYRRTCRTVRPDISGTAQGNRLVACG